MSLFRRPWTAIFILLFWGSVPLDLLSPAFGQDLQELIRTIDEQQQKIQAVTADFSQVKETSFTQEPLISSGLVKFKRPDRIHWIYLKPEPLEIALDGKFLWLYNPGHSQAEKYSLTRGKRIARYLEPLTAVFQKTFAQLAAGYTVGFEGIEADRLYHFRLQPREDKIQQVLSRADLWIDKTSGAILRCKMVEFHRDQWSLEFKNLRINPPLTDDDLRIRIPPSVRVQEQSLP
jgi:outer membrane lipoprotein-sorting protein